MPTDAHHDDEDQIRTRSVREGQIREGQIREGQRPDEPKGAAEPETLLEGAEGEADTASRLSMESSDPPASWAGPDTPPANKQRA